MTAAAGRVIVRSMITVQTVQLRLNGLFFIRP